MAEQPAAGSGNRRHAKADAPFWLAPWRPPPSAPQIIGCSPTAFGRKHRPQSELFPSLHLRICPPSALPHSLCHGRICGAPATLEACYSQTFSCHSVSLHFREPKRNLDEPPSSVGCFVHADRKLADPTTQADQNAFYEIDERHLSAPTCPRYTVQRPSLREVRSWDASVAILGHSSRSRSNPLKSVNHSEPSNPRRRVVRKIFRSITGNVLWEHNLVGPMTQPTRLGVQTVSP